MAPPTLTHERDDVYRVDITGVLHKADLDQAQAALARVIEEGGRSVRLLVVLEGFEGWAPQDNWGDLRFYTTYGPAIARIAIVGDLGWRSAVLMFVAADLREAPVEYFAAQAIGLARAWLRE